MRPHEVAFGHKRQAQGSWAARVLAPLPVPMACAMDHMQRRTALIHPLPQECLTRQVRCLCIAASPPVSPQ